MTEVINAETGGWIQKALSSLDEGGVVGFPTDTVYGIGVRTGDPEAVQRLYTIKGRAAEKDIPVLIPDIDVLRSVAQPPRPGVLRMLGEFWPGPLTAVLLAQPDLPTEVSTSGTVGVRIPAHPVTLELLGAVGAMAVTSANLSGGRITRTAPEVLAQLEGRIELLIDGGVAPGGAPSTVVDCSGEVLTILREGPIKLHELQRISDRPIAS